MKSRACILAYSFTTFIVCILTFYFVKLFCFVFSVDRDDFTSVDGMPGIAAVTKKINLATLEQNPLKQFSGLEDAYITLLDVYWPEDSPCVDEAIQRKYEDILNQMKRCRHSNPYLKMSKYSLGFDRNPSPEIIRIQMSFLSNNLVNFNVNNENEKNCFSFYLQHLVNHQNDELSRMIVEIIIMAIKNGASSDDFQIVENENTEQADLLYISFLIKNINLCSFLLDNGFMTTKVDMQTMKKILHQR